jgi:O-antigen ligase
MKSLDLRIKSSEGWWLFGLSLLIVLTSILYILTQEILVWTLPTIVIATGLIILDYRWLIFMLFFSIPLSTEVELPGGFGTDFPSEILMWLLTGISFLIFLSRGLKLNRDYFYHPLTLILGLHLVWILMTTFWSTNQIVSSKFFLAKVWYVVTFYFVSIQALKYFKFKQLIYTVLLPLTLVITIILFRHSQSDFLFSNANFVVGPFFRNHVASASLFVLFIPFIWYLLPKKFNSKRILLSALIGVFVFAIYVSYTRAAYVALGAGVCGYFMIHFRLSKLVISAALIIATLGVYFLVEGNKYLDFAPEYSKTITHNEFDNLLAATAKGEDISTMERVYRWVAGYQMVKEKPLVGFGPGNFYNTYKSYTVTRFRTYVSGNPEMSGIHSYYFMILVDQGFIGLIIFLALIVTFFIKLEKLYHRLRSATEKRKVMAAGLSFLIICTILTLNDMVETDKVGSFFFFALAILVETDVRTKNKDNELARAG